MSPLSLAVRERLSPFVLSRVRDPHAAEDVLQETLLAMIERLHSLRCPLCFWPWIYRIARRKVQDHFRRQERWVAIKEEASRQTDRRFHAVYGDIGGLERMIAAEDVHWLSQAIQRLDARQRHVVRLRCFEHASYEQIAAGTRMSEGQARTSLHRARMTLRRRLHARSA
jgi:RNA polymerase sigma-70 factor (ECF subfamily)